MKYLTFVMVLLTFQFSKADCETNLKNIQFQMDTVASNIANINTTRTPEGGPYKIKEAVLCGERGCKIQEIKNANILRYDPRHPDADQNGYVAYPDIDVKSEIKHMNLLQSMYEKTRSYCAE